MKILMTVALLSIAAGCAETGSVAQDGATAERTPQLEETIRGMMEENRAPCIWQRAS